MISKLRVVSLYFYSVNKTAAGDGHSPGLGDGRPRPVSALNAASLLYFLHVTFSSKNQLELIIKEPRPKHFIQWIFFFFLNQNYQKVQPGLCILFYLAMVLREVLSCDEV